MDTKEEKNDVAVNDHAPIRDEWELERPKIEIISEPCESCGA